VSALFSGWRVYVPVIVGNALVQAATVAPFATPAPTAVFVALTAASFVAFVVSVAFVTAQAAASSTAGVPAATGVLAAAGVPAADGSATASTPAPSAAAASAPPTDSGERMPFHRPALRTWITATVAVLVIALSAVLLPPVLIVIVPVALIVLAGRGGVLSGFRAFAGHPVRAALLALASIVVVALLWIGALLAGFFITGVASAALTWLVFGCVAVLLLTAWRALNRQAG
jgi:hypothetical protein